MNNKRLSLADFKAKAENTNTNEILEKVQGGESSGCHGWWGQLGKSIDQGIQNWMENSFNTNDPRHTF